MKRILPFLFVASVNAAPCIPYVETPGYVVSDPKMGLTKNGGWIRWTCWSTTGGPDRVVTYVGTLAEIPKVSGRLATIMKAADPLKSLQTLPNRITVLPLTDPSLAAIVADIQ